MGFKDLFIEKEEEDDVDLATLSQGLEGLDTTTGYVPEDLPEINPVDIGDEFVSGAYEANNLTDLSRSIFKVEELANTLPSTLPTDTKKTTVTSIMSSFNLTPEEVVEDGETRVSILTASLNNVVTDLESQNVTLADEIEELKTQISKKETEIAANKDLIKNSTDKVNVEVERINNLITFIK